MTNGDDHDETRHTSPMLIVGAIAATLAQLLGLSDSVPVSESILDSAASHLVYKAQETPGAIEGLRNLAKGLNEIANRAEKQALEEENRAIERVLSAKGKTSRQPHSR